jgi:hypothetical protein
MKKFWRGHFRRKRLTFVARREANYDKQLHIGEPRTATSGFRVRRYRDAPE